MRERAWEGRFDVGRVCMEIELVKFYTARKVVFDWGIGEGISNHADVLHKGTLEVSESRPLLRVILRA